MSVKSVRLAKFKLGDLQIGGMTQWGKVAAICWISGERYYFMDENGAISMIPAVCMSAGDWRE